MAKLSCFPALLPLPGKKKKKTRKIADANNKDECPKVVKPPAELIDATTLAAAAGVVDVTVKVVVPAVEDRRRNSSSSKEARQLAASEKQGSDLSDFDFHFHAGGAAKKKKFIRSDSADVAARDTAAADAETAPEDPPSPKLKRSCSNIETKRHAGSRAAPEIPARSRSFGDLGNLIAGLALDTTATATPHGHGGAPEASPASSVKTADRVMLKKRSSSQVLPSRSRKLWWRLFLWSHRNLHVPPRSSARAADQEAAGGRHGGGYTSDTFEEEADDRKNKNKNKKVMVMAMADDSPPPSSSVPNHNHNQWVAFCAENSIHDRVSAWVSSIDNIESDHIAEGEEDGNYYDGEDDDEAEQGASRRLELGEPSSSSGTGNKQQGGRSGNKRCAAADEVVQANAIVQSLNAFSSVAHIAGMGLKVVPMIAPFSTLRAVNLSSNFIVHISPGSLPKGLHSLDLSRNKIANVEGLRELTKLRVLNLSYNRMSRIGHGLSNCTAIRELYLAGNKLSDVEGLHRLLKLAVLDLSFNRITTAKALGQLVANYHSLLALNLVGNPVQANVGDDALRRAVTGLLPSLAYLNKQPLKPKREVATATDTIARAALGGGSSSGSGSRKRTTARRFAQMSPRSSALLTSRGRGGGAGGGSPTPRNPSRRR